MNSKKTSPVLASLEQITRREGDPSLADRLATLQTWLASDLYELEQDLAETSQKSQELNKTGDLARKAAAHLIAQPGKRIRPLCIMIAARMGNKKFDQQVKDLAIACELMHAATLLHDDVLDEGEERRGTPTSRVLFGNTASVLAGDHLLLYALRKIENVGKQELLSSAMKTMSEMIAAETLQLEQRRSFLPSRENYISIVEGKTAALFRWGLRAGGTIASLTPNQIDSLGKIGFALGKAFQLIDDVLDLEGDPKLTGKNLFTDLREGKLTWPIILGCERDPNILPLIQAHIKDASIPAKQIVDALSKLNAIADTRALAESEGAFAKQLLQSFPPTQAREAMKVIIDTIILRHV